MSSKLFHTSLLLILSSILGVYPITQDVYWRDYIPGEIPYDAVEAAPGRYVGQVYYDGFIVAHIYPDLGTAVYQYRKRLITKENIKILCSRKQDRLYWEEVDFYKPHDQQMKNAVQGGYVWDSKLFIGKTQHDGEWKIGEVFEFEHPKWAGLWIWNAKGAEIKFQQFHMLKYNSSAVGSECQCKCDSVPIK